jgi:DNA-binding NarL/FixJ family response regulator
VDDDPAMREMLVGLLRADFNIVGALSSGASVLEQYSQLNPGVILLEVSLGDMTGFEVAGRLRWRQCAAKIVFVSVHENVEFVRAALDLGASGYVFKSRASQDLGKAIQTVSEGGRFIPIRFYE